MAKVKPEPATAAKPARVRGGSAVTMGVVPELGGTPAGAVPPPRGSFPAFKITVHPDRWTVLCGRVVPNVRRLRLSPGSNAVGGTKAKPLIGMAETEAREHGWQVLDWDHGYMCKINDVPNGWTDIWTTVYPGSGETSFDEEGYSAWLRGLVDDGTIPQPAVYILDRMRDANNKLLVRFVDKNKSEYAGRINALRANLTAIDAEIETIPRAKSVTTPGELPDVA